MRALPEFPAGPLVFLQNSGRFHSHLQKQIQCIFAKTRQPAGASENRHSQKTRSEQDCGQSFFVFSHFTHKKRCTGRSAAGRGRQKTAVINIRRLKNEAETDSIHAFRMYLHDGGGSGVCGGRFRSRCDSC